MLKRFIQALILTALTAATCVLITTLAFEGRPYYFAQLLAIFLVIYLGLAWFVYLKRDGFKPMLRDKQAVPEHKVREGETDPLMGMIKRAEEVREDDPEAFWGKLLAVLLWSAMQLGVLATVLYYAYGIGARFFV